MTDLPETPGPNAPTEPLITVGTITAVAAAVVGAVVAFGIHLTADQRGAILTLIGVVAPFVVAVWGRAKVFAPATVHAMVGAAKKQQ